MEHRITAYIQSDNIISALGLTTAENMAAIRNCKSGISLINRSDIASTPLQAAVIDRHRIAERASLFGGVKGYSFLEQLFILSIADTFGSINRLAPTPSTALILSTTKGNVNKLAGRSDIPEEAFLSHTARKVAGYWGIEPKDTFVISNACISGVSALILAQRLISYGVYKEIIVAGGDLLSPFITSGFLSFKSVSPDPCRPYDAARNGLNLGEACGSILLSDECREGAIAITGGAVTNDANHISGPSRTGDGLFYAIRNAMHEAGITASEVDFVNAHGTATAYNDEMESKAIKWANLQNVPTNSLKPYFGHTLGASGIIETIVCAHALQDGFIPATLNFENCGVPCPLTVEASHRIHVKIKTCVKTASGFGGCNAAVVLQKDCHATRRLLPPPVKTHVVARCTLDNSRLALNGSVLLQNENDNDFASFIRDAYKFIGGKNMKFYKMSDLCKTGYVATETLLQNCNAFAPEQIGILLANRSASLDTDRKHQDTIDAEGETAASPAVFVYTLPNVASGEICIRHKIQGENTFFIQDRYEPEQLEKYACTVMAHDNLKYCIIGWCEFLHGKCCADLKLITTI